MKNNQLYQNYLKRIIDFSLAIILFIVFAPFLLIISFMVRIKMGTPILFKQMRPGKNNEIFTLYKFRTMKNIVGTDGKQISDDLRLTKLGNLLRSTSLDELPSLINIIKGEMSFVGPRPLLQKDLVFMSEDIKRRHVVLPGLTGLAQISGRNNISWKRKFDLDLAYINELTFKNDIKIMFKTILVVLKRNDISTDGMSTSEDYGDYLLRNGEISEEEYNEIIKQVVENQFGVRKNE
jgi:undecaprenyl phosphate N,N'-diacetylbacillosamine 1-phosphate transferase